VGTQTNTTSSEIKDLYYTKHCLAQKCKRLQIRCNRLKEELKIKKEKNHESSKWQCTMQQIITDANNMNPRAILILDQIKNYNKKIQDGQK
jgi:hypothetical protein